MKNISSKKENFSKDSRVVVTSLEDFFRSNDKFHKLNEDSFLGGETSPSPDRTYFKFTSRYLVKLSYGYAITNYGKGVRDKLELIEVAYRNDEEEYALLNKEIAALEKRIKSPYLRETYVRYLESVRLALKLMPEFALPSEAVEASSNFESFLLDTGVICQKESLKGKYLVLDLETNGLLRAKDDLLSFSLYDPDSGVCYNRLLPLDQQPTVLTTFVHGLKDEDLFNAKHIGQEEFDWLLARFNVTGKTILTYSGGGFDADFLRNYCKRQNLIGVGDFKFKNIKSILPPCPIGSEGKLTKDNLCRMLKIEGVSELHSSLNDCILEWRLFEKIEDGSYFFKDNRLYRYVPGYVIPISYLNKNPNLYKAAGIKKTYLESSLRRIYELSVRKKDFPGIKQFPSNITGIALENGIYGALGIEKEDNYAFLRENARRLEYMGRLETEIEQIPVSVDGGGMLVASHEEDIPYVDEVNSVTKLVVKALEPLRAYLKDELFKGETIKGQEMSISADGKILALCDLSSESKVLEIKAEDIYCEYDGLKGEIASQLYREANGRETYLLEIKIHQELACYGKNDSILTASLYRVDLKEYDPMTRLKTYTLDKTDLEILKAVKENPGITARKLQTESMLPGYLFKPYLARLEGLGYLENDHSLSQRSHWRLLRPLDEDTTQYLECDGDIIVVKQD